MTKLTIAVTGLNATDNPGPGVPVIRAIRAAASGVRIVGLGYDALDPGAYVGNIADHVYLLPYPSCGSEAFFSRLAAIHATTPIDVLVPTLDAELPIFVKLESDLRELGIRTLLPTADQLALRAKDRFDELRDRCDLPVPRSKNLTDARQIDRLGAELRYPLMVKGQFYEAYIAHTPADVHTHFHRLASKWGAPIIVQEFVAGDEFDVVAVGDGLGGLIGSVPIRKMQLTDKGKAWGGVTIADPKLDAFVHRVMAKLAWRGPCELEIIRCRDTGQFFIIEINPRFPAWVYLTVGAQRNLPWATVQLALGREVAPMTPAAAGVMFLRYSADYICDMRDFQNLTTTGELHRCGLNTSSGERYGVADNSNEFDRADVRSSALKSA